MLNNDERDKWISQIINNQGMRIEAARDAHLMFFSIYLPHYVQYETADFQKEIFELTQDTKIKTLVICAFRASGKSTLISLSYPLWAIMGKLQKKHILITSKTQDMARRLLESLKAELTDNTLLKADMGPFRSSNTKWGGGTIELSKYKARIVVASVEEGIRGIRYGTYRPDLIICDDVEDLNSVATQDSRDKTYRWFKGDLIPTGDRRTNIVVIGNLLHDDSLIMRLRKEIRESKRDGVFEFYPLIDYDGNCLWPGKYPDEDAINDEKRTVADDIDWSREYLLKIISDAERVVHPEWLHYYDELPNQTPGMNDPKLRYVSMAVDLAISEKESANYTAVVTALVYSGRNGLQINILPGPINRRMDFPTSVQTVIESYKSWTKQHYTVKLCFDSTAYQAAFGQHLKTQGITAEEFTSKNDKRSRLSTTTALIQTGKVLFPRKGAEELIHQITGFGRERYDDLADAFTMLVLRVMADDKINCNIGIVYRDRNGDLCYSPDGTTGWERETLETETRKRRGRSGGLLDNLEENDPHGWGRASRRW
ncbi:hypothetical protein A3K24_02485 [candidate division Kazan bacterium RIFCSPHIGHO2_01_FULL_44_14]|uniref:Terminase large subunit gp17-like C-terminal domain-containing protein n=1 Tax=candidate division Kazan bacterium RIFCSPLOWO2_01_FULL_45_19 TaxID=1798538 RepID=A0A1F4NQF2_UNCK3|nr:hypothetical protein [uncultured bacterium]AQS31106.1 hypothetical protein [uncultured bacterium]OGB73681.1 MAG: hypothetical protein A3K51_02485 [candidate division Kazan bacterium RIFCSPLOWO2_01_FULL_45_19]OGB77926.1 MAG: hypothetical protein A3K24_02485 [candidate division Kazan bacterium RIFCSPHIGHO2_01_FULL_44_14]